MTANNDLLPGDWIRNIRPVLKSEVEKVMERERRGYRLLPYESTVAELVHLLDLYDRAYQNQTMRPPRDAFAKSPKNMREGHEAVQPAMGRDVQPVDEQQGHPSPAGD